MMAAKPTAKVVAVVGKGGTGKTATVTMMGRVLRDLPEAGRLLLVDADPAGGLLCALGVTARRTMGEIRERIIRTAKGPDQAAKAELAEQVEYLAFEALTEHDGFGVLAMGRTETLGCYCPVNSLLRDAIASLSKSFDTIRVAGAAGLAQVHRQVVKRLGPLLVLPDPTARGIETASVIRQMVDDDRTLHCERIGLIFNRVRGNEAELEKAAERVGIDLFGMIPYDEHVADFDFAGTPITSLPDDAPSLAALRDIVTRHILSPVPAATAG